MCETMEIRGFQKTTLLDYPGHVAATVFTGGCNFRCPFCHNGSLVLNPGEQPVIPESEVLSYLEKRRRVLEGVCVTGGEPTLQNGLREFMERLKNMGFLVKLDTNGSRPEILKELVQAGLVDYVAMDIKASWGNYGRAVGLEHYDTAPVRESADFLKEARVSYEFRTTVVRGIHEPEEFEEIGKMLAGCENYYLQGFRESDYMVGCGCSGFSAAEMEEMAEKARKYIDKVQLRGVE